MVIDSLMTNVTDLTLCAGKCDEDVTCQYFTYNEMSRECSFYEYVEEWGVSSFATTFGKLEEYCALEGTFNNTRTPTLSPTTDTPTATDAPTATPTATPTDVSDGDTKIFIVVIIEEWCTPVTLMLLIVYLIVCCGVCFFVCFTSPNEEEDFYQLYAIVPDSIEYSIEY